jgi:nitroreductase
VADGAAVHVEQMADTKMTSEEAATAVTLPQVSLISSGGITDKHVRDIVAYAVMAPSGGNAQPWRFVWKNDTLECHLVPERSTAFLDYRHFGSYMALGAAVENISLMVPRLGFSLSLDMFPDGEGSTLVCRLGFTRSEATAPDNDLFEQIGNRVTNRKIGDRTVLEPTDARYLNETVEHAGRLQLVTDDDDLAVLADLLGRGDRLRFVSRVMNKDLTEEIRWNPKQVEETRDGLDVATLELSAVDIAGLRLATNTRVMEFVGRLGGGRSLEKPSRNAIAASSAVGLVTLPGGQTPLTFFKGGRAMQRAWLASNARGYAFQPMTAIVCLYWRLIEGGQGLSEEQKSQLQELRSKYLSIFNIGEEDAEIMLFRIGRADPPTARALRRRVDDVLEIG